MPSALEFVENWLERVWHQEDASAIADYLVPDTKAAGLGAHVLVGPDDFKAFHGALTSLVRDIRITIDHHMEDGDWFCCLVTLRGQGRDSGLPVEITGNIYSRIKNGVWIEAYNNFDFQRMFEQLKLLPENSFARCLGGEKLGS